MWPALLLAASLPFVLVDPGHGGVDSGAVAGRVHEQRVNLQVARRVAWNLRHLGIGVLVLRQDEGDAPGPPQPLIGHQRLELSRRATLANRLNPDIFVSLHANAGPSSAHGPIVFVGSAPTKTALRCAWEVERRLVQVVGGRAKVETGDLYLLRHVRAPSILVESGFLSNPGDRAVLTDQRGQAKIARAIAEGIWAGLRGAATSTHRTAATLRR